MSFSQPPPSLLLKLHYVAGRLGRGKKRAGDDGKGKEKKRGSRLSPRPIVQRALFIIISIFTGIPSESLCILLHLLITFLKSNAKECEVAMKSTSLLSCFLVDIYGQVEVIAYF